MTSLEQKGLSILSIWMIGKSASILINPVGFARSWRWRGGPRWYNHLVDFMAERPVLWRALAGLALGVGVGFMERATQE